MNADFLKLAPGDLVRIIMPGHRYRGRVGTVNMVAQQGEAFVALVELWTDQQDWLPLSSLCLELVMD